MSIKPSAAGAGGFIRLPAIHGSQWDADNATADTLIAYGFDSATGGATALDPRIVGGPNWLRSSRFTIAAKIPIGSRVEQVPAMVRTMLLERFQLQLHRETREMVAFSLSVVPGGPKLATNSECGSPDAPRLSPDGVLCGTIANQHGPNGSTIVLARGVTADEIANWAFGNENSEKDKPVANRTGLGGLYNFKLTWTPESSRGPDTALQVHDENVARLQRAVREQLGLALNLAKSSRQPVQVWVIDHIALPAPN